MKPFFLASLTNAVNAYLKLDPESNERLSKLRDKKIAVELLPLNLKFQCVFDTTGVTFYSDESLSCETTIRGTPMQMMGVMLAKENRQRFFADDLVMEGNAELGQQIIELFDRLEIDWEDYLSKAIGDVPAFQTGQFIRGIKSWLNKVDSNLTQDITEYLQEETEWLPTREALQDFFTDVDVLRMDVDRAEAKIHHLQTLINNENKL